MAEGGGAYDLLVYFILERSGRRPDSPRVSSSAASNVYKRQVWECSAHQSPADSMIRFGDVLKGRAAIAMNTLWDAFLAWKDAEEATIAAIKVLCCTVVMALKGVDRQANYPANLLFRQSSPKAAIMDKAHRTPPQESFVGMA